MVSSGVPGGREGGRFIRSFVHSFPVGAAAFLTQPPRSGRDALGSTAAPALVRGRITTDSQPPLKAGILPAVQTGGAAGWVPSSTPLAVGVIHATAHCSLVWLVEQVRVTF